MDKCKIRELWFQVNTLRRAALRPYFQEIGLTVGQGQPRILNSLRKYGTMTQRELADCCFVDVTTISRTVDRLVAAGLLSKQIDPECRRSCLIIRMNLPALSPGHGADNDPVDSGKVNCTGIVE